MQQFCQARTARESAKLLGLSETTIITHRKKAYKRMNVKSLRQLMGSH
ncbi:LuxR C-terminal-related transcriptional regulator [Parasedimentitalea denitrificans]